MQDIISLVASLQQTIINISNAPEAKREQLAAATKYAHELLLHAKAQAEKTKNMQLVAFIASMLNIIEQLQSISQNENPNENLQLNKPQALLAQIINTYRETIVPILSRASNFAQENQETINQINNITRLGSEVVECCTQVYRMNESMDNTEKLYAMLGMVLMFAGVGMLIALTVNPATGIPVVVALTTVALGCALCRKSVARLKDKTEAVPINTSLDHQRDILEEIADNDPAAKNYPRQILRFTTSTAAAKEVVAPTVPITAIPTMPDLQQPEQSLTVLEKLKAFFNTAVGGDKNTK